MYGAEARPETATTRRQTQVAEIKFLLRRIVSRSRPDRITNINILETCLVTDITDWIQ